MVDPDRYRTLFVQEAREHLGVMAEHLPRLREGHAPDAIDALFRAAHSFKGMAATLGYEAEAGLAHHLEDHLAQGRASGRFEAPRIDLLLAAVDQLAHTVDAVEAGQPRPDLHVMSRRLAAALDAPAVAAPDGKAPTAVDLQAARDQVPTERRREIRIQLDAACNAPRARLLVIKRTLAADARLVAAAPDEADWHTVRGGDTVTFLLDSERAPDDLRRALLRVPDVASCELQAGQGSTPPTAPAPPAAEPTPLARRTVRVDLGQVDHLLDQAAELHIAFAQLDRQLDDLFVGPRPYALAEAAQRLYREARGIYETALGMRMLPVTVLTERYPRLVRELATRLGKEAEIRIEGSDAQADRSVLEVLADPLTHLIKNALDHGIEAPADRTAAGKARRGIIRVAFQRTPGALRVTVADDGRGIPREAARRTAIARGLVASDAAAQLDDDALFRLLATPGFSTAERVTDVSGRGVGLDAVKASLERAGGSMRIASASGAGTTVTLELPPTLAVMEALECRIDDEPYYVPVDAIVTTIPVRDEDRAEGVVAFRDPHRVPADGERLEEMAPEPLPIVELRRLFALPERRHTPTRQGRTDPIERLVTRLRKTQADVRRGSGRALPAPAEVATSGTYGIVVERHGERACVVVDEVGAIREIVVKTLDLRAARARYVSGATIQGDGRVGVILDVPSLLLADLRRPAALRR